MKLDYSSNNDSLAEIPREVFYGEWSGVGHPKSWRRLHFRTDDHTPGYDFDILFSWYPDDGKKLEPSKTLYRASVSNCWTRSKKIRISQFGVALDSIEYNRVMGLVKGRILRLTGYRSLLNKKIYCYRLNHMFTFPLGVLENKDCHHISSDNEFLKIRSRNLGINIPDVSWLKASDDRIRNMLSMNPHAHSLEHSFKGDGGYNINYRSLLMSIDLSLVF